nr:hypothetical protein [uncultured Psychroserpens sp.]
MSKNAKNSLWLLIVDKLIIAGILVLGVAYFDGKLIKLDSALSENREIRLEEFRSQLERERERNLEKFKHTLTEIRDENKSNRALHQQTFDHAFQSQQRLIKFQQSKELETLKEKNKFENDISIIKIEKQLAYLEKQLSEFYWPVRVRFEKNNAIWYMMSKRQIGGVLDSIVLANHLEILDILENKLHLAAPDKDLETRIGNYINHVEIFRAMRLSGNTKEYPGDINSSFDYNEQFSQQVKNQCDSLQAYYNRLILEHQSLMHIDPN